MKKRIVSLVLAMAICFAFAPSVYATEILNGDLSYEEGGKQYVASAEDNAIREAILNSPTPRATIFYKALNVTAFQQSNNYYCGPATVKQTLHFINDTSEDQTTYANALGTTSSGTDMTRIVDVLNAEQDEHTYIYSGFSTFGEWIDYAKSALSDNVPAVLDINTQNIASWPYVTSGHFVNLSGLNYDDDIGANLNVALITDPYGPGFGNHWYGMTVVYNANADHFRSAMIH